MRGAVGSKIESGKGSKKSSEQGVQIFWQLQKVPMSYKLGRSCFDCLGAWFWTLRITSIRRRNWSCCKQATERRHAVRCGAVRWAPMTSSVRLRKRKEEKNISRSRTDRQTDRQKANYSKGFAPVFQSGVGLLAFAFFPSLHDVKSQYEFRELFRQWQRGE